MSKWAQFFWKKVERVKTMSIEKSANSKSANSWLNLQSQFRKIYEVCESAISNMQISSD